MLVLAMVGCPADDSGGDDGADAATGGTAGTSAATNPTATSMGPTSNTSPPTTTMPDPDTGPDPDTATGPGDSTGETSDQVPCQPSMAPAVVGYQTPGSPAAALPTIDDFGGEDPFAGFLDPPDAGDQLECDLWAQDCPAGEKCMPWANDGGPSWNATRCSPLDPNPGAPGDACTVEGSGVSGIDDCETSAMCFGVDTETGMGTCVEMCTGSPQAPVCDTPNTTCTISNMGVLILCRPVCNPLADECPDGQGCYPVGDAMVCSPDGSGDDGAAGDPCEFINACDNGLYCAGAASVPGCAGATGCCSPFCTVGDDTACLDGQTCMPTYPGGAPLECLEGVGQCST